MKECIVVLSYNEKEGLYNLLRSLVGRDIIVVIDGDDGSVSVAHLFSGHVLYSKEKRGYGRALKDGLQTAFALGYKTATVMDVGTCDPWFIDVSTNADVLVRARKFDKLGFRAILSVSGAALFSLLMSVLAPDVTYGYRTYNLKSIIGLLPLLKTNGHATNLELLGLAIKTGRTIEYIKVPYTLDKNTQLRSRDILEAAKVLRDLKRGKYCLDQVLSMS